MIDQNIIIKWINSNSVDIKNVGIGYVVVNLLIVALAIMCGEFITLILNILRILLTELFLFVPIVYLTKFVKENS